MPLDFRYHLASLAAVFAALVLGILLGVAMKEGPRLSEQVAALQSEFTRAEQLRSLNRNIEQFNVQVTPLIVRNHLLGRNIILIRDAMTFPRDRVEIVKADFERAGADVPVVITLKSALLNMTPQQEARVYRRLLTPIPETPGVNDLLSRLGRDLGRGWTDIASAMEKEELIEVDGMISAPASIVVLLGGAVTPNMSAAKGIDLPLLKAAQGRGLRIAAAELHDADYSAMSAYQGTVPLTVDNIDLVAGRVALILALSAEQQGNFGFKPTADALTPESE